MKATVLEELRRVFNPEFLNRIDETIVFHSLDRPQMSAITQILLRQLAERMKSNGITINFEEPVVELLIEKGFDPSLGARPLKRSIQKLVEDPLSEYVLRGQLREGSDVLVTRRGDDLAFTS
jgi:ATP-dependent Clp protease ATP-binding subunit ClpA